MNLIRSLANWWINNVAWLLADWFGWRVITWITPALTDQTAIVTGANTGIGLEVAKALAHQGCRVIVTGRTLDRAQEGVDEIRRDVPHVSDNKVLPMVLDYEDFSTVRKFVDDFHAKGLPLNILVNNAGIHLKQFARASFGFERTLASNYFGHVYLTQLLLEDLIRSGSPQHHSRYVTIYRICRHSDVLHPLLAYNWLPDGCDGCGCDFPWACTDCGAAS